MIKGTDSQSVTRELNREKLPDYWGQYFSYEKDDELCGLTEGAFKKVISEELGNPKPCIDSIVAIGKILAELGKTYNFRDQFNERHPHLHMEQVLGMQLYKILVEDKDEENPWFYSEIQHKGHASPNAIYFTQPHKKKDGV